MKTFAANPFRFGALALDDSFTDRERERAELASDIRNGQDVVIYAPRRIGKSSLAWSAAQVARLVAARHVVSFIRSRQGASADYRGGSGLRGGSGTPGVLEAPHNPDPPRYLNGIPARTAVRANPVASEADVTWRAL